MFKRLLVIFNGLLLALLCFEQKAESQVVSATGGGFFSNNGYTLSYTYGELSVKTFSKNNNILTEGFQQGKYHPSGPVLFNEVQYFPNPVDETLTLRFYIKEEQSFTIQIYNILGKLIEFREIQNVSGVHDEPFTFGQYGKGLYLIKLQSGDGKLQRTFKIEKI